MEEDDTESLYEQLNDEKYEKIKIRDARNNPRSSSAQAQEIFMFENPMYIRSNSNEIESFHDDYVEMDQYQQHAPTNDDQSDEEYVGPCSTTTDDES